MAKRRVWSQLSGAYRTRLMRSGINQETYEAGVGLSKARGHAETPEHPVEAIKNPSRYAKYRAKIRPLYRQVEERKRALWESRFKYDDMRQMEYVKGKMPDGKAPGIRMMLQMLKMTDDELDERVHEASVHERDGIDDDWKFLFYH